MTSSSTWINKDMLTR